MSVRSNVVANLIGRSWIALMGFAFVPFYIRLLGMEAYGLIGFFTAMMAMFAVLDLGMGLTINRELARMSAVEGAMADARTLLRTLEGVYWVIALLVGGAIVLLAPLIADHWLQARSLSPAAVEWAIRLMGVVAVLRWPVSLYTGALQGLQRQVRLNVIAASGATLAGGGAVLVLQWYWADIHAFFGWQVLAAAVQVTLLRSAAWRALPLDGHRPAVVLRTLRATLRFSTGVTMITILSIILTQLDKLVLSRLLPLAEFGYYALAGAIASVLIVAGATVETATFPALSRLNAAGRPAELAVLYHRSSQALAVLVLPLTTALALFAPELLTLYIHDPTVVARTHLLLSLFAMGNGILAIMFMPLSLQLAYGWTNLSLYKNVVAVALFIPALFLVVPRYGAAGAACLWIALTLGYLLVEVQVMHRRLLPGEQWRWYVTDVGSPVAVSLAFIGGLRLALPAGMPATTTIFLLGLTGAAAMVGAAVSVPIGREALRKLIGSRR